MTVVFVWAWWSGVSNLVQLFLSLWLTNIVCIDSTNNAFLETVKKQDVPVYITSSRCYTVQPYDIVIYSAATPHVSEVLQAQTLFEQDHHYPPPLLYFEFLGELSKYLYTIGIAWTHGKSTTTAMTAEVCKELLPQTALAIVWAAVTNRDGKSIRINPNHTETLKQIVMHSISRKHNTLTSPLKQLCLVVEADEFNHHFHYLDIDILGITTIDHDHLDTYPTKEAYLDTFIERCSTTRDLIVLSPSATHVLPLLPAHIKKKTQSCDLQSIPFDYLLWWHNQYNASLAVALTSHLYKKFGLAVNNDQIINHLTAFKGLARRAEYLWTIGEKTALYSDYGHHPAEIISTLQAFRERYPHKTISCLIEPHQARRILTFRDEFTPIPTYVQACYILPCYTARESWDEMAPYITSFLPEASIDSFATLSHCFADAIGGQFVASYAPLETIIEASSSDICIGFSAWPLDEYLRSLTNKKPS